MQIKRIPYSEVPLFSQRDKAYIDEVPALRPFYKYSVEIESFRQVIQDKRKDATDRQLLVEVLKDQHSKYSHPAVRANIEKLASPNTFTLVTAHQPSLFTGPLYYIFKNISVINLARQLNEHYPEFHFVPVFLTGGEDHDFEEVNHLHLFNRTLTWESGETGSVGQMSTKTLRPVLDDLQGILGESDLAKEIFQLIERTHTSNERYADAALELAHELFKKYGLVVFDASDRRFKKSFAPIIREEIFKQVSKPLVEETFEKLAAAGYPSQAFPREINFFYLGEQFRERIVEEDGQFKVLNTDLSFSPSEMETEIEQHPERFSPNVIMRPLMQELVLPNLAYIGGGGELAYWLERKSQFEHFGLNFPMLIRRNSSMWIDRGSTKRIEKLGLSLSELWDDIDLLLKNYLVKHSDTEFSLQAEQTELEALFLKISEKAKAIDPSLERAVLAEHAKAKKGLENMETRLLRAEKQRHDQAVSQIRSLKEKLFPNNGLQERHDNFLSLYLKYGDGFFDTLLANFDPLEKRFLVILDK